MKARGAVACVVAGGLVLALVALVGWRTVDESGSGIATGSPTPTSNRVIGQAGAPPVPAHGAYVGAWVKPQRFTQDGYRAAVKRFERRIGRRLDIVHTYRRFDQRFPTESDVSFVDHGSYLLFSWAANDPSGVAAGDYDATITAWARAMGDLGKPVFVQWRWEMDRPNLQSQIGSPTAYKHAWKHVQSIFVRAGVHNVAWVWCPTAEGFEDGRAESYYPGDGRVDWLCVDVYPTRGEYRPVKDLLEPFLTWAARRGKPIMIGEYGATSDDTTARARWLRDAADTFRANKQIKAVVYFDSYGTGSSPDYALDDPSSLDAFRDMATSGYFNPRGWEVTR